MINNIPDNIMISGVSYPLKAVFVSRHSSQSMYIMVSDRPVVSVEFSYDVMVDGDMNRAELAVSRFIKEDGKYTIVPDTTNDSYNYDIELDVDSLDFKKDSLEVYSFLGSKHICIESEVDGRYFQFIVFDKSLCKTIITNYVDFLTRQENRSSLSIQREYLKYFK